MIINNFNTNTFTSFIDNNYILKKIPSLQWHKNTTVKNHLILNINNNTFSKALNMAKIIDNQTLSQSNSIIWYPYGLKLLQQYNNIIREIYEKYNLEEFSYPSLIQRKILEKTEKIFPIKDKIYYVNDKNTSSKVLSPTGESAIYTHWAKIIQNEQLPLQIYCKSTYFRPISKHKIGIGTFITQEATDVFEFHCAYQNKKELNSAYIKYYKMLRELLKELHLPVYWTIRPQHTNNSSISKISIGADVFLPLERTLQVATIYLQEDLFSKPYDIKFKKKHTQQLAGFTSKRIVLSKLFLSLKIFKHIVMDPEITPKQISIIVTRPSKDINLDALNIDSLRFNIEFLENKKKYKKTFLNYFYQGIPLIITIMPKRSNTDKYKIIIFRNDTLKEATLYVNCLSELSEIIKNIFYNLSINYTNKINLYMKNNFIEINNLSELDNYDNNKVISIPLKYTVNNIQKLEKEISGEVLGFYKSNKNRCIISHEKTNKRAIFSRRI